MSDKKNKWTVPAQPPPPLFTGKKERDFAKQISDELIEKVIGQPLLYYPIDVERTEFHPLYKEAIKKTYMPPIRVYALIEWEDPGSLSEDGFGVDHRSNLKVHFHKRRLTLDQDLYVREGDIVEYAEVFYEISSLAEPRQMFGQGEHKIEIEATCIRVRSGVFDGK